MALYNISEFFAEYIGDPEEDIYGPMSGWWESTGESIIIESEDQDEIEKSAVTQLKKMGHFSSSDKPDVDFTMHPEAIIVYTMEDQEIVDGEILSKVDHQIMLSRQNNQ